jgi:hypothetical protein
MSMLVLALTLAWTEKPKCKWRQPEIFSTTASEMSPGEGAARRLRV